MLPSKVIWGIQVANSKELILKYISRYNL